MATLDDSHHKLVSDAVAAAELHSSGEIVTVVAERSDGYSDVALVWSAAVAFTAIAVLAIFPEFYLAKIAWVFGGWNHEWTPREVLGLALAVGILKFVGMWLIQLWRPLKFLLVPGPIKTRRVRRRAVDLFKVGAERRTTGRTGVLIYLSMHEHRAEIVADAAIAGKVAPETWGDAMADMLAEIRHGRIAEGMAAGVRDVGVVLAKHFPRDANDTNELPDRLIEL
jgi:putative membrane protein